MNSDITELLHDAFVETNVYANRVILTKEMVSKFLTADTDVYAIVTDSIKPDETFCGEGFMILTEALRVSMQSTMFSTNIVSRRGHEEVIDFLNSVFTTKTEEGPNLLRVRLFDVAMYFAKQVRIRVGGAFPDQFYPNKEEWFDFDKVALLYAAEIIPGVFDQEFQTKAFPGINVSLYIPPPPPDDLSYAEHPWILFFYQMLLDLK